MQPLVLNNDNSQINPHPSVFWHGKLQKHVTAINSIHQIKSNPTQPNPKKGPTTTRRFLCESLGFQYRYVPVGLLERLPARINDRPYPFKGRDELGTLLASGSSKDWLRFQNLRHSEHSESDGTFTASKSINVNECVPLLLDVPKEGHSDICEFSNMELFLQVKLNRLLELLSATKHEPRLKGAFPTGRYRAMLTSCQQLLDMLHSMWAVTNREAWRTSVRPRFVLPAQAERRTMVGNVLLLFGLLSTAIELKSPMPPFLPPAEQARERLLGRVQAISDTDHSQNDFLF
ncbi:hypothetical protein DFH28DRAFT_1224626 [Melampsora americana]|nr:hypothetical protein DFH28DRAFT_1224626 [Melampsora americana]